MHNTYTKLVAGIQKYFKSAGVDRAIIGVSGGVDSALCLKLAVDALGADHVTALLLPEKGVSSDENLNHSRALCDFLKVKHHTISINKFLMDYMALPWKSNDIAQMNTKARIRMTILYNFANTENALVIGTSNKTELAIGYGTKYGDLGVDIDIIGDLYKTEVYKMAEHVGLPTEFLDKAPSAELYNGQTDEEELGMTYKEMDTILKYAEKGATKDEIISKGLTPNSVHKTFRLINLNRHKVVPPPIIELNS